MKDVNLYHTIGTSSAYTSEEIEYIIDHELSLPGISSSRRLELRIARDILGNHHRRSLYDTRLADSAAPPITWDALAQLQIREPPHSIGDVYERNASHQQNGNTESAEAPKKRWTRGGTELQEYATFAVSAFWTIYILCTTGSDYLWPPLVVEMKVSRNTSEPTLAFLLVIQFAILATLAYAMLWSGYRAVGRLLPRKSPAVATALLLSCMVSFTYVTAFIYGTIYPYPQDGIIELSIGSIDGWTLSMAPLFATILSLFCAGGFFAATGFAFDTPATNNANVRPIKRIAAGIAGSTFLVVLYRTVRWFNYDQSTLSSILSADEVSAIVLGAGAAVYSTFCIILLFRTLHGTTPPSRKDYRR